MSNGNSGFTKIYNAANQFSTLTVGDLNASNIDATIINGEKFITVTGYAPTQFATTGAGAVAANCVALLTSPNQSAPTATTLVTDSRLLQIPTGVFIRRVVVTNNGIPITNLAGTFTIGLFTTTGTATGIIQPTTTTTDLLTTSALATINTAGSAGIVEFPAISAAANVIGGAGAPVAATTGNRFVRANVATGAGNSTGSLRVEITYSVFPVSA